MKYEIKDINQCVKEIEITVPADKAMQDYRKILQNFKNYVNVPGFRKGKAPISMVENIYFEQAKEAYIKEKIYEYYDEAIKDSNLKPLFEGIPTKAEWEKNDDLKTTFKIEIEPNPDIQKYTDLTVEFKPEVYNEDVFNGTINNMRQRLATEEETIEPVQNGDLITVEVTFEDTPDKPEKFDRITVGMKIFGEEFDKQIIGKKTEDRFQSKILRENKETNTDVKVVKVNRRILPEIDEEFAKNLGYDTVDDMNLKIAERLKKEVENKNDKTKQTALLMKIAEENKFDVPPTSVYSYSLKIAEPYARMTNKSPEEFAHYYTSIAEMEIKNYYIIKDLMGKIELEISDEDNNKMLQLYAEEMNISTDEFIEKNPDVTNNEDFVSTVKERKLIEHLIDKNTFTEPEEKNNEEIEDSNEIENKE